VKEGGRVGEKGRQEEARRGERREEEERSSPTWEIRLLGRQSSLTSGRIDSRSPPGKSERKEPLDSTFLLICSKDVRVAREEEQAKGGGGGKELKLTKQPKQQMYPYQFQQ